MKPYKPYIQFFAIFAVLTSWARAQDSGSSSGGWSFSLADLLAPLFNAFTRIVTWVFGLAKDLLVALLDLLKDLFVWCFDQVMSLAVSAAGDIDVSAFDGIGNLTSFLPVTVLQVLAAVGVGQALAMIAAAILIRLGLQLIPFVRLGS